MSQWWEWPTMDASTVPFAATHEGGQLKALGNPAVWWGVTANFLAVTPLWALVALRLRDWGGVRARFPATAAALDPLLIPFATLYAGYLLNLVPYQLIARSKFVYHYIPALMQGVLLFATAAEGMVRFGGVLGGAPRLASRAALLALYALVLAGFLYWGLPYGYGYKISPRQNAARMCEWVGGVKGARARGGGARRTLTRTRPSLPLIPPHHPFASPPPTRLPHLFTHAVQGTRSGRW